VSCLISKFRKKIEQSKDVKVYILFKLIFGNQMNTYQA